MTRLWKIICWLRGHQDLWLVEITDGVEHWVCRKCLFFCYFYTAVTYKWKETYGPFVVHKRFPEE